MVQKDKIFILNTGGTFNKIYDPVNGKLIVEENNNFLNEIIQKGKISHYLLEGILYKDSLDFTQKDREILKQAIEKSGLSKILIIHGTDTIDQSAEFIAQHIQDKQIVFTGAMIPYSIQSVEAVANLMMGYGYLLASQQNGVFISMHGAVKPYNLIKKNKELGIFECHN